MDAFRKCFFSDAHRKYNIFEKENGLKPLSGWVKQYNYRIFYKREA